MTLYHFGNCVALIYLPYYFVYKYSSLSEYGAFWKCIQAGVIYAITQLCKMLVLATFFPDSHFTGTGGFDAIGEFLKCNVDLMDLIGLYVVLCGIPGRGHIKILTAGLGWAGAEILLTRFLLLWVGARGAEFDWKYIQKCLESNVNVINHITIAALVWMWSRYDTKKNHSQSIATILVSTSYKSFVIDLLVHSFRADHLIALIVKSCATLLFGLFTLRLFIQYCNTSLDNDTYTDNNIIWLHKDMRHWFGGIAELETI